MTEAPPNPTSPPPPPWPRLREELRLHPGPATRWGAPTWTIHDPSGQRFFRLGWQEMEILQHWDLANPDAIVQAVMQDTTLRPMPEHVMALQRFLVANNLTISGSAEATAGLLQQKNLRKKGLGSQILHGYLFIRIPLFRPDEFLSSTLGLVNWMFSRTFVILLLCVAGLGLSMILREWTMFRDNFSSLLTLKGGLLTAAALGLSKCLHELGHAYACKRMGLQVPSMGVALMCFAPVLWTDTTEAWKLPSKSERLTIGASGVMAELVLAAGASILWPLLPDSPLRTAVFMLAGSVWIMTLMVNINPCMRYDGYYLLSDYWDEPGLQPRASALAKWWLREQLFGYGEPPPEALTRWDRTKIIVYALCVWVYRFFLFLGIAFMVYYLFFKALGFVLMIVELLFFIFLPIFKEVGYWVANMKKARFGVPLVRTCVILAALVVLLIAPWHGRVEGAAILTSERRTIFYAPVGAVIREVLVKNGDRVEAGTVLFRLESPDLDARIELARRKLGTQRAKLSLSSLDLGLRVEAAALWDDMERTAEDLAGLEREREQLVITAPFAGLVIDIPEWMGEGGWVMDKEPLAALAGGRRIVQTFVPEYARERVTVGGSGLFYPAGAGRSPTRLIVESIENQSTREISFPELASVNGGPLGAHKVGDYQLEAEQSIYRVICRVEGSPPPMQLIGEATLEATRQSLIATVWQRFLRLLVRESSWS